MSWFSKATGIHWGNIAKPIVDVGHAIGPALSKLGSLAGFIPGIGTILAPVLTTLGNVIKPHGGLNAAIHGLPMALAGAIPGMGQAGGFLSGLGGVGSAIQSGLSTVGNVLGKIPGISEIGSALGSVGSTIGNAAGGLGKDIVGGLSSLGNIFKGGGAQGGTPGNVDWGQLANLGLGAMDAYNAANSGQKANSLLNKGIGQYNDNWNQGKATIMNPAPLPIAPGSQASNPFARGALDPQVQALQAYLSQQQQPHP